MKTGAFSIYDAKAEYYSPPFFYKTNGMAIRAFTELVNDQNSSVSKHPDDYRMFRVGDFDDDTAQLTSEKAPILLARGDEVAARPEEFGLKVP